MCLFLVVVLLAVSVLASDEVWPQPTPLIQVECTGEEPSLFECKPNWGVDFNVKDRVNKFIEKVSLIPDYADLNNLIGTWSSVVGHVHYGTAKTFFGLDFEEETFLKLSYYLDYFSNNILSVVLNENKPGIGFSAGVYAKDGWYYDTEFMDALRNITVSYNIIYNGDSAAPVNAIGYLGTFVLPFAFSETANAYHDKFAVGYSIDKEWATGDGATLLEFVNLFKEGESGSVPPGVFMLRFLTPSDIEVNTLDPLGKYHDTKDTSENWPESAAKIDIVRFNAYFALRYGLRNYDSTDIVENLLSNSARDVQSGCDPLKDATWNFCKSLHYNNKDMNGHDLDCNVNNLPSAFFTFHTVDDKKPFLYSTRYQILTDFSCQYQTPLNNKGNPTVDDTTVEFGYPYEIKYIQKENGDIEEVFVNDSTGKQVDDIIQKDVFIMNSNDFFSLKKIRSANGTCEEDVQTSYPSIDDQIDESHLNEFYYVNDSMCNTAVNTTYVLYDMKEYSAPFGILSSLTPSNRNLPNVYAGMRSFPTKTNYTSVVAAMMPESGSKIELQKCVNVFLDTAGGVVSACNDVAPTWDWAVFGGSFAGLVVVIGLWVWGGLYAKQFKADPPTYYKQLLSYEKEYERLQGVTEKDKNSEAQSSSSDTSSSA